MMARQRPPSGSTVLEVAAAAADFLGAVAAHARWHVLIETVSTLTGDLSASL